jgi:hypothetical protein
MMHLRLELQLAEAFGDVNRWYCSEAFGRQIDDRDLLLTYYIKSGGVANFAFRFIQAMGDENRWYCSQYYRREIHDPRILWEYYMNHAPVRAAGNHRPTALASILDEMSIAC